MLHVDYIALCFFLCLTNLVAAGLLSHNYVFRCGRVTSAVWRHHQKVDIFCCLALASSHAGCLVLWYIVDAPQKLAMNDVAAIIVAINMIVWVCNSVYVRMEHCRPEVVIVAAATTTNEQDVV